MFSSQALKELIERVEPHVKGRRPPKVTAEVSAKAAAPVVNSNNGNSSSSSNGGPQPDQDWLAGTNVNVTQKVSQGYS